MVVKNENSLPAEKNLRVTTTKRIAKGFSTKVSAPISPKDIWCEGPAPLYVGDTLYVYFDMYRNHRYGVLRSLTPVPDPEASGYVMPYGDCPLDTDKVGEAVYMDILYRATDYVHIMSPYLILDGELETALCFAAQRGVDVKLILPGIPDKKVAYSLAKTHYRALHEAGVKIYEYTPGFVHAKVFVSDDIKAVVGTINLDYRSLYHHFECATYMYDVDCISDIENDFKNTLRECHKVTYRTIKEESIITKGVGTVTRLVAPLL
jgi:cardiolipin synthase